MATRVDATYTYFLQGAPIARQVFVDEDCILNVDADGHDGAGDHDDLPDAEEHHQPRTSGLPAALIEEPHADGLRVPGTSQ